MGTILTESDVFGGPVVHPNPQEIVSAAISMGAYRIKGTATPDGDLIFSGATNSNVRVRTLGGVSMALGIVVVGNDISIQLATDGLGNPTSLANAVVALYAGTPAAVALASLVAGGAGTGICGIQPVYMRIGDDDTGSIRPMMQNIINRTRYLYNRVIGILFGTKTLKSLYVDGVGDNAIAYTAGSIFASNNLITDNNVTAKNNVVALLGNVNSASGNVNAFLNVNALTGDVIAANEVKGDHLQVDKTLSMVALPTTTYPLGYAARGSVVAGAIFLKGFAAPGYDLVSAINVASVSHPTTRKYTVVFNFTATYAYASISPTYAGIIIDVNDKSIVMVKRLSLAPVTYEVYIQFGTGLGENTDNHGFELLVFAE